MSIDRRAALMAAVSTITMATTSAMSANAACLAGDTSEDCIGIYKVPIDDEILPYVESPELLAKYAPDVRWVPPTSYPRNYKEALKELPSLQEQCQSLEGLVLKGDISSAGQIVLGVMPRLTVIGRVMTRELASVKQYSVRSYRIEVAMSELVMTLGQCDMYFGQALRGELGSLVAAQIQILPDVREAVTCFDEFMNVLPAEYKG